MTENGTVSGSIQNDHGAVAGDMVTVIGEVIEYSEMTELDNIFSLTVLSSGNALPNPLGIATGDLE